MDCDVAWFNLQVMVGLVDKLEKDMYELMSKLSVGLFKLLMKNMIRLISEFIEVHEGE